MDKLIYGIDDNWREIPVRIAYLGNGEWEIQVGDGDTLVLTELEEAMRQLKEENPE